MYHREDQALAKSKWIELIESDVGEIEFTARRYSPQHSAFRWMIIRGHKICDEKTGEPKKIVGLFRDIDEHYLHELSLKTISEAFSLNRDPCFVVDFAVPHVEVTESFYTGVGLNKTQCNSAFLLNLLPVEKIKSCQNTEQRFFTEELEIGIEDKVKFDFSLLDLKQEKYNDDYYRYAVCIFKRSKN